MRPAVIDVAPAMSKWRWDSTERLSRSSHGDTAITAAPTGTLMKKTHDHERYDVSTPPTRTPAAAPLPEAAPQMPSARFRSRPSRKVVIRIESAAGASSAPPSPCAARKATSETSDHARPQRSEERRVGKECR